MEKALAVLWIGDIHSTGDQSKIDQRLSKLAGEIAMVCTSVVELIVIHGGDIANTGERSQFKAYEASFKKFRSELKRHGLNIAVKLLSIPGNHDALLDNEDRNDVVRMALKDKVTVLNNKYFLDGSLHHLDNYFEFENSFTQLEKRIGKARLNKIVNFGGKTFPLVKFVLLNSAWLSTRDENRNLEVVLPEHSGDEHPEKVVTFVLMHHHPSWLRPETRRELEEYCLQYATFLLTGHEHSGADSSFAREGDGFLHDESPAFFEHASEVGGVALYHIHPENRVQTIKFQYDGTKWCKGDSEERDVSLCTSEHRNFRIKKEFLSQLDDPGIPIAHRHSLTPVKLPQIYVPRSLDDYIELQDPLQKKSVQLKESDITSSKSGLFWIAGSPQSGKSSLAKSIYKREYASLRYPIFLNIENISAAKLTKSFAELVSSEFKNQYQTNSDFQYAELPVANRVLILDGWPNGLSKSTQNQFRQILIDQLGVYGKIYVLLNKGNIDEWLLDKHVSGDMKKERFLSIHAFGYREKRELIRNWIRIGSEGVEQDDEDKYLNEVADAISFSFATGLLPHIPMYVITLLQAMDSQNNDGLIGTGNIAFHLDTICKVAVTKVADELSRAGVENAARKLTRILKNCAIKMESKDQIYLTKSEYLDVVRHYREEYKVKISATDALEKCIRHSLLMSDGEVVKFRHKQTYVYYLASAVADFRKAGNVDAYNEIVDGWLETLYRDSSVSALMIYLSNHLDMAVVKRLRAIVDMAFAELSTDFEKAIEQIGDLQLDLSIENKKDKKKENEERVEVVEQLEDASDEEGVDSADSEFAKLSEVSQMFINGSRATHVLCQLSKYSSDDLPGAERASLASSVMRFWTRLYSRQLEGLLKAEANFHSLAVKSATEHGMSIDEMSSLATRIIRFFAYMLADMSVENGTYAVGTRDSVDLVELIDDIDPEYANLVEVNGLMQYSKSYPKDQIISLAKKYKKQNKDNLGYLLRIIVHENMYLYRVDAKIMIDVCSELGIKYDASQALTLQKRR